MRVLYLSYWNLEDPLTAATVYPNLKVLAELDVVEHILFVNTERADRTHHFVPGFDTSKVTYAPLRSKNFRPNVVNKILDFILFPRWLAKEAISNRISLVIARGSPAGALAYLTHKRTGIPFVVESFEPHADYMRETGNWNRFDLRYLFQRHWETKQKETAKGIAPVTENFRKKLIAEGVSANKIMTVPCTVNVHRFHYNAAERATKRSALQIPASAIVGLYAGKYGGLYMDADAFLLYQVFFQSIPDFYLILLSPTEHHQWIHQMIRMHGLPGERIFIASVPHNDVPAYCSAADFGFATIKSYRSSAFCSAVKIGEYWAAGLPIVLTRGVGDESAIIEGAFGGVLFDPKGIHPDMLAESIKSLLEQLKDPFLRTKIASLAARLRSPETVKTAYNFFLRNE